MLDNFCFRDQIEIKQMEKFSKYKKELLCQFCGNINFSCRIVKERLEKVWEPAVTKHRAEAVKRQLEAAAAVKEAGDSSSSSSSSPTEARDGYSSVKLF